MTKFRIVLHDEHDNLYKDLTRDTNVSWEWNRVGGCGQAAVQITKPYDYFGTNILNSIRPKSRVKIYINDELRYQGKVLKPSLMTKSGIEQVMLTCYGYLIDLNAVIVNTSYEGYEISSIVADILDTVVIPNTEISASYTTEATDYAAASLTFQHSAKDAIGLLAGLAGDIEWGVDMNRQFFFKKKDKVTRRVFVIGRDIENYQEERNDENVINTINVFGAGSSVIPLSTLTSQMSVNRYGERQVNLFESSIVEPSDANRLGYVTLVNSVNSQRAIKCSVLKTDEFLEASTPLGAVAINRQTFTAPKKYGTHIKYGRTHQYGNIRNDQISNIKYDIIGGGMYITLTVQGDIPNIGDQQKRIEYEVRDLQRR